MTTSRRQRALLLQLEFPTWETARPWTYSANFAVQEGLQANGVECVTVPVIAQRACSSPKSWLYHARKLLAGQRFDQVWLWLIHTPLDRATLEWVAEMAPVRIGVLMESLQYDEQDYAWAPQLRERRGQFEQQLPYLTHVLAPDERDAAELKTRDSVRTLWWPPMVPERSIRVPSSEPSQRQAVFHGTPYGRRQGWVDHSSLRERLFFARPAHPPTRNQLLFDRVQQAASDYLGEHRPVGPGELAEYVRTLRRVRLDEFNEWMAQLPQWPAIVNLPSLTQYYGGRVFESMAVGRPVISWAIPGRPKNLALFQAEEEILLFQPDRPEALARQIDRILQDSAFAGALARRAQDKVKRFHTAEQRLRQTLDWLDSGVAPDYGIHEAVSPQHVAGQQSERPSGHQPADNRSPADSAQTSDDFYVDLFVNKPHWSTPEPNADESARWSKIASFLEHIVRETKRNDPNRALRIIDVGCGRGWLTNLASGYGTAEGVEPVAGVIEYARRLFPHLRFAVGTPEAVLARQDFRPFDIVLCSEVIEHVPYPQKPDFVRQLSRVLTPDGYLILTTPRGEVWEQWSKIAPPNQPVEDWVTELQLGGLFKANGFHPLAVERIHVEIPSLRYLPAATRHELHTRQLMPIYQVWACRRDGVAFGGPQNTIRRTPMVSVIVPTFNRPDRLRAALRSIARQSLQDYEVIVVNDAGTPVESAVTELNHDGRITLVNHDRNRGLAASRNTGLRQARGKYVCYLDDDDRYLPDHLETLVSFLEQGEYKAAYTDAWRVHERLDGDRYVEVGRDLPYSHEFNPANLLVSNYFPVLCVMHERSCLDDVGVFDEALFAHEDWDLWIRIATKFPFKHIKRTTAEFTWRDDGSSMTSGTQETYRRTTEIIYRKYRSYVDGVPALSEMQRQRLEQFSVRQRHKRYDCSIVIPVHNHEALTRQCLETLAKVTAGPTYEVIVVDNGSSDGTAELLSRLGGDVQVIRNRENLGFAKACNQGAAAASGTYLVLLNNDTIPLEGWLSALVEEAASHPDTGIVGSRLLYPDKTIQHAGVIFDRDSLMPYHCYKGFDSAHPAVSRRRAFSAVTAACMLVRREVWNAVGGFDEAYRNGFEDVDLCLKAREKGWKVIYQPASVVFHLEGKTEGRKSHDRENADRLFQRWGDHWRLVDEDVVYAEDGYKAVAVLREGQQTTDLQLLEPSVDAAGWKAVAAVQAAAARHDDVSVKNLLQDPSTLPGDPSVLLYAAEVCGRIGQQPLRLRYLRRALEVGESPKVRCLLAREALEGGRAQEAEQHLQRALETQPARGEAQLLLGVLHMQRERYADAIAAFTQAAANGADARRCRMGVGMASLGASRPEQAWDEFVRVLNEKPDDADALHWVLQAGTASQRWKELADLLDKFVARNPGDLSARFALAGVLVRAERIDEARREYEMLRAVAPNYDGLSDLGRAIMARQAVLTGSDQRA